MKKLGLFAFLGAMMMAVGCSKGPADVVETFSEALLNNDAAAIEELVTDDAKDMTRMMLMGMKMAPEEEVNKAKAEMEATTFTEEINGDTATVYAEKDGKKKKAADLKKVDGKWKIDKLH